MSEEVTMGAAVDYTHAEEYQTMPALALPIDEDERPTTPCMPPLVVSWRDIPP
jgi:hypothetical protein